MDILTISLLIFGFILGMTVYELQSIYDKVNKNNKKLAKIHKKTIRIEDDASHMLQRSIPINGMQSLIQKSANQMSGLQSKLDKLRDRLENDEDEQATVYDPEKYCAKCDRSFDTSRGLAIHNGHMH